MEKLFEISWGILEDTWIEHKFDIKNIIPEITRQEIVILLQNLVNCIKFLKEY